jgi:3-methylcrotonyl-CoA carboxylase alpha subunit
MGMIASVLVANRGEIAVRIIRSACRMGIRTVAVFSDADRAAQHVALADEAIHLGPAAAAESYLHFERVLAAARRTKVAAIHPGYGFLSENADFAVACRAAGIEFIGPDERAIRVMGSKSAAKEAVAAAGVRTIPGYLGERQDVATLAREADRIGYPLLVKAVAGGGGKGMRIVREAGALSEALSGARREARAAFGDDRVLLERFLERPRHVEVQVFGDRHGNLVHLFERDCSLQRRHQKVIEEAPAPGLSPQLRATLHSQALAAARAVSYVGAGTVEFLVEDGEAWFIEMNTRLQVEHPITELITGLDLVEWQFRIASGEPLPLAQSGIHAQGHAVELRICAEDPRQGLLPSIGRLTCFELEGASVPWVRFDTGFVAGDTVTPHYDSMLAKLIVHGPDRASAIERAHRSLRALRVAGVATNRSFLDALLGQPAWLQGHFDTNLITREQETILAAAAANAADMPVEVRALLAIALLDPAAQPGAAQSPWDSRDGFSPNLPRLVRLWVADGGMVRLECLRQAEWRVSWTDGSVVAILGLQIGDGMIAGLIDGQRWSARLLRGEESCTWIGAEGSFSLRHYRASADAAAGAGGIADKQVLAPMPGQILAVHVKAGDKLERGARLVTLEAMKMEHTLTARSAATVSKVDCEPGQRVQDGAVLLRLDPV